MTDHDPQHQDRPGSFHWPPTTEELESIQVVEVDLRDEAATTTAAARPPRWPWLHRLMEGSVIAQAGLAAASLAAIGIAVTSLLVPAQPAGRSARIDAQRPAAAVSNVTATSAPASLAAKQSPATIATGMAGASAAPTPPSASASTPAFRPMVELELERRTITRPPRNDAADQPRVAVRLANASVSSVDRHRTSAAPAASRVQAAPRRAGKDPVSRFAAKTGTSIWKAMRAVGRSFSHQRDADND